MSILKSRISDNMALLDDLNSKQIETNRTEAQEVKKCFTDKVHNTLIASAAILTLGLHLTSFKGAGFSDPISYFLLIASLLTIVLCQTTATVGCHKYNTANRTTAYQIHLSRIIDYEESNINSDALALELRRIDWEEAMYAWRLIQPMILRFFYVRIPLIGILFKRFKFPFNGFRHSSFKNSVYEYPWYDSRELLKYYNKKIRGKGTSAHFYPGTYLRRMLIHLFTMSLLSLGIFIYMLFTALIHFPLLSFYLYASLILVVSYTLLIFLNCWLKCLILESGLLSIQTSAFLWRIVSIALLVAKIEAIKENKGEEINNATHNQIYYKYTLQLARVASEDLFYGLGNIHEWLKKQEIYIMENIK